MPSTKASGSNTTRASNCPLPTPPPSLSGRTAYPGRISTPACQAAAASARTRAVGRGLSGDSASHTLATNNAAKGQPAERGQKGERAGTGASQAYYDSICEPTELCASVSASRTMAPPATTTTSKFLSLVLRHRPELLGLELDAGGWVLVDE